MDFIFEVGRSVDPVDFSAASVATLLPPPRPSATPPPAGDERAVLNLFSKLVGQGEKMAITLFMTKVRLSHGGVGQGWDTFDILERREIALVPCCLLFKCDANLLL